MAENTSSGASGAVASVTGFFKDLVNQATPAVQSYFDYRANRETAKANLGAGYAGGSTNSAGNTSGQPANVIPAASSSITSKPWFWPVVIGGVLILTLGGAALLLGGRKK